MGKGRNINLYIREADAELWEWAEQQAAQRRLALSQFVALVLERARDAEDG